MDMTGEERIGLSREAVWAALNDVDVLKQCIPGCQSLERQSDTDMAARVKLTIGPVSATFSGKVKLSDLDPPNGYRIAGEGSGGAAGYAKGHAVVRLVTTDSGLARSVLERGGALVVETNVLVITLANKPGALAEVAGRLSEAHVNIEYSYGSASGEDSGILVMRVDDVEKAKKALA